MRPDHGTEQRWYPARAMRAVRRSFDAPSPTVRCEHLDENDAPAYRTPWLNRHLCRDCADDAARRAGAMLTARGWRCPACGQQSRTFMRAPVWWSRTGVGIVVALCAPCFEADTCEVADREAHRLGRTA